MARILNWILLIFLVLFTITLIAEILTVGFLGDHLMMVPVIGGLAYWLFYRLRDYDDFRTGFAVISYFSPSKPPVAETQHKEVRPYPMQSGAENAAIGAVDRCCEFAAFCEEYVIPAGICSPEQLDGFIMATPRAIIFGFTWKTFYYTLDSLMKEKGFSLYDGGFEFSSNSGMVSYERQIWNNETEYEAAYTWMMNTPVSEIIAYFTQVAETNFTSLGINSHSASCRCTRSEGDERSFVFTV